LYVHYKYTDTVACTAVKSIICLCLVLAQRFEW